MKRCPFLGGACIKQDCALWFQEVDKKDQPVMNMCGCAMAMTAQYLMEMRPSVCEIESMAIRQDTYFDKINEKLGLISDHTGDTNSNLVYFLGGDKK